MDADDRELLAASVAASLDAGAPAAGNDAALTALGWPEMLDAEPVDSVAVVFERLGSVAARSTVLDDVVGAALGLGPGAAVIHPGWGTRRLEARDATTRDGVAGERIRSHGTARLICSDGVATVDTSRLDPPPSVDDRALARITLDGPADGHGDYTDVGTDVVEAAVTAARHAVAHQLNGLAAGMLALARQHALDRMQFGRPIGSFQAVRHKLAETHVAIEAGTDALAAADDNPTALTIDLARVLAGRAAIDAGRHCQQVLAGIGFTRDHDFHRFLFAAIELDGLYGTTATITQDLGRGLIRSGRVPRTVDL